MVAATKTFSGDLSTSLTSSIADLVLAAATSGGSKKAQALSLAKQYGVDPMLSKGEFFAQGLAEGATSGLPSFMRYRAPEINESYLARGQGIVDPLMGLGKDTVDPMKMRLLPEYQKLASLEERRFRGATGQTPPSPLTEQLSGVTGISSDRVRSNQGVKVHDEKLGQFLAAVALSLSSSLDSVRKRLGDTEEAVITVKDGVLNLHKQLEVSNDVLENKLDQIIAALRNQNNLQKLRDDKEEAKTTEEDSEKKDKEWSTQVAQKVAEDDKEFQARLQQEEMEDFYERIAANDDDLPINEGEDGSGYKKGGIASGPDSGYWAKLHGDELITPLDNNFTQGETMATNPIVSAETGFMPGNNPKSMVPKITSFNRSIGDKSSVSMVDRSKNIVKAMELPFKTTGIALMQMLGDTVRNTPIFGAQTTNIKSVAEPVADAFGISNSIANNALSVASSQQDENKRREETKNYKTSKNKKPWWKSITDLFNRDEPVPEEDDDDKDTPKSEITSPVESKTGMVIPKNDNIIKNSTTKKNWFEGAKNWWNRGRNARVPSENTARWFGRGSLMADDASQMTHSNRAFKSGKTDWKSLRPWKAFLDPEMRGTGPTPAIRQAVERPLRAMRTLGSVRGGFVGLILNELMNPAPLADGTLEGNKSHSSFKLERETLENNLHFIERSRQLDTNSKENIFTKMETTGGGSAEPTIINNGQNVNNENIPDQSYIQQSGDSGMGDYYPSAYA